MNDKELISYLLDELQTIHDLPQPDSLDSLINKYYECKMVAMMAINKAKIYTT